MPLTGIEIRQRSARFASKWSVYEGSERSGAQTFLNELFPCYGQDREAVGAQFEEPQAGKFVDLLWPRQCVIEMKAPKEAARLASHRAQARGYWENAADPDRDLAAPRYRSRCARRGRRASLRLAGAARARRRGVERPARRAQPRDHGG